MFTSEESSLAVRNSNETARVDQFDRNFSELKPDVSAAQETVRVKVSLLNRLMSLTGEMVLVRNQQVQLTANHNDIAMRTNSQKLDMVTSELQECVLQTRMQPVGSLFSKFNRTIRDLASKLEKEINFKSFGDEVELDKSILEIIAEPLSYIIYNACNHGIESPQIRLESNKEQSGNISISAWYEGGQVYIEVEDDGKGFDLEVIAHKALAMKLKNESELETLSNKELANLILTPGFRQTENSDQVSEDISMATVNTLIEQVGGKLEIDTIPGKGTSIRLQLPLTLAIIPCLIIRSGDCYYAIPQANLEELVTLYNDEVLTKVEIARGCEVYRLRNKLLPLVRLSEIMNRTSALKLDDLSDISRKHRQIQEAYYQNLEEPNLQNKQKKQKTRQSLTFAVLKSGLSSYGLIIDDVVGTEEIVVKSMHPYLKNLNCYIGATILGDGSVALILDISGIADRCPSISLKKEEPETEIKSDKNKEMQQVLLFQYGSKEHFAVPMNLINRIEKIETEDIELVGDKKFITIDGVSTQIIELDRLLSISEMEQKKVGYMLIPKHTKTPVGILTSVISDSTNCSLELNTQSYMEDGLLGTDIIDDKMTLFIDMFRLIEKTKQQQNKI